MSTNNYIAIPITKKFWIVEDPNGDRIGTVQIVSDGTNDAVLVSKGTRQRYPSINVLGSEHNIKFTTIRGTKDGSVKEHTPIEESNTAYGYPIDGEVAYNISMNVQLGAAMYTKTKKSKAEFAAGYFLIKYDKYWVKEFCPRKLALTRYDFRGPWKTPEEQDRVFNEMRNSNE